MLIQLTIKEIFGAFAMAFVISCAMTPVAIWLAPKIHAMDIPKARGMHDKPMPRFGGMAIYLGTMCSILYFLHGNESLPAILVGGTLIYALGAADDIVKGGLNAKFKFACQTAIAVLMYYMGLRITFITNYFGGGHWQFGTAVCLIVTVLWIVGITNTINLIDGLDGLAAGVAAIAALSIAYVAYIHGDRYGMMVVCVGMMAIAGSSLGFLPFNFYPAKLFMGDSGSLFLGFMIAIFAVISPLKRSTLLAVIVPVLVLGIPIFDTAFAILRRVVSGKPIMSPDKEHLHHHLMRLGYGQRRAVLMIYGICAIMGMAAVIMSRDLYLESVMLILTAFLYIYVFLTDQNHKVPVIRMQDAKEKDRSEGKNTDDSKADEKKPDENDNKQIKA
ncbi:MAG: undecaprenyl/decaprenyl-phosphate alpha-N-acetylglucosaminyl 1-phosphate transferase [Eubacterium sp.]|nr:undecaprenyl/decaprenyl-phosphate alpha-N-acetylglucosaminyl 1-phosphate transferase [Eubacterium sp.]